MKGEVALIRAGAGDAEQLWSMQTEAFSGLLAKYQDFETSPGNEPLQKVRQRLAQSETYFYFICAEGQKVGAIRVVDSGREGGRKRISPLFILEEYRGRGFAQKAIRACEAVHGTEHWALDTILQEEGNCRLYEKMGYRATGETRRINDAMTLVYYEK
ncbi:GNAT family N-acetyltransferase [Christensenellaceae bacterium 44-20]